MRLQIFSSVFIIVRMSIILTIFRFPIFSIFCSRYNISIIVYLLISWTGFTFFWCSWFSLSCTTWLIICLNIRPTSSLGAENRFLYLSVKTLVFTTFYHTFNHYWFCLKISSNYATIIIQKEQSFHEMVDLKEDFENPPQLVKVWRRVFYVLLTNQINEGQQCQNEHSESH